MQYDDPEKKYQFEKIKEGNIGTRAWFFVVMVFGAFFIIYLLQKGFNPLSYFGGKKFEPICKTENIGDLKMYEDFNSSKLRADNILRDNLDNLKKLPGFYKVEIVDKNEGYNDAKVPVFQVTFSEEKLEKSGRKKARLSRDLCGFAIERVEIEK